MSRISRASPGLLLLWLVVASANASAAPGDLDTTFGVDGWAIAGADDDRQEHTTASAIQPNGRIVVVGSLDDDLAAWRFLPNGYLDTNFGDGGISVIPFPSRASRGYAVAIDSEGRIVIGGSAGAAAVIARLLDDGSLDESFAGDGTIRGTSTVRIFVADVETLPDGSLVAAMRGSTKPGSWLLRFTPDGTLDTSFGESGIVQYEGSWSDIDVVGESLVAIDGALGVRINVARFTIEGDPDPIYGSDGLRGYCLYRKACDPQQYEVFPTDVIVEEGQILISLQGYDSGQGEFGAVMRLSQDGSRDAAFGADGVAFGVSTISATALAVDDQGIVLSGFTWAGGGSGEYLPVIERFTAEGASDPSFGDGGVVTLAPDPYAFMVAVNAVLQPDGNLVVLAEPAYDYNYDWFALVRLREN